MKNILLSLLGLVMVWLAVSVIFLTYSQDIPQENAQENTEEEITQNTDIETEHTEIINEAEEPKTKEDIVREKIERIKKRLALKWLIIEGDSYYRNDQLALALKKYLEFYKENPDDSLIHEKIWDTYFEMKKYASALNYYKKIEDPKEYIQKQMARSLFYTTNVNSIEERIQLRNDLWDIWLNKEQYFYYTTSLACSGDFHECKLAFQEYFWPEAGEEPIVQFQDLKNIKTAIENYRNFQIDQVYLKNAYIIGAWYGDKLYNLAIHLWEELLVEKPWYKPVLQIIAQSHFELWNYEASRDTLAKYYEEDDDDPAVTYMLGIINTKLREYVLANIYLQKTIKLWYTDSLLARRQLIFNLYTLENDESMLQEFTDLIEQEESYQIEDLRLAIYYHILHGKYDTALKWSKLWQNKFPETADFYAYEWWILRELWDVEWADSILQAWLLIDESNPFLLINIAYNELEKENTSIALIYFKKIVRDFPVSEFALQAEKEIEKISEK